MNPLLHQRLVKPLMDLLTQGITPEKLALSLAFGIGLGIFPVAGTTTLLCFLAAIVFRLNVAAIQLVNYLVYPLWFACLIPFIRLGEWMFRAQPIRLSVTQMLEMSRQNLPHAISLLWLTALRAAAAWLLIGPLTICILYFLLVPVVRRLRAATLRTSQALPTGRQ